MSTAPTTASALAVLNQLSINTTRFLSVVSNAKPGRSMPGSEVIATQFFPSSVHARLRLKPARDKGWCKYAGG